MTIPPFDCSRRAWILASVLLLAVTSLACSDSRRGLHIEDVWSRPTAPERASAGAASTAKHDPSDFPGVVYLTIRNEGNTPDRLLGMRSPACETVAIHRTFRHGDRMRMAPVEDGVAIPAGALVSLEPGGLHAMLLGLRHDLVAGDRVELVLTFETAGEIVVETEVRPPTG